MYEMLLLCSLIAINVWRGTKVNDSSYLCKIELEVANPECTENIERRKPQSEKERNASPRSVTSEGQNPCAGLGSRSQKRKFRSDGHPTMYLDSKTTLDLIQIQRVLYRP
ncbi:unnamed protein product [Cylicocyclus nassatus]|uniref:Secreted protein n=1 Tax=Cylicocyclus nassatus TaxID=53992 RepID=A0AA36DQ28_CYLNA|nr:unnamed protein product [Cylicocyclus nassatus]